MNTDTFFYAPPESTRGNLIFLPEDETRHLSRVLRLRVGDEIAVVDGEGGWHQVVLEHIDRNNAHGRIIRTEREVGEPSYALTVGLGLLKNQNRFEVFLEKAAELGVKEVVPLVTDRTEKIRIKMRRAQNILVAAMKQCKRSRLVNLTSPVALEDFLKTGPFDLAIVCHGGAEQPVPIAKSIAKAPDALDIRILIGPEGGFSAGEIEKAQGAGYEPVSLGLRRLRAETAALVAATAILLLHKTDI